MVVLRGREGVFITLIVVIAILGIVWMQRGGPAPLTVSGGCASYSTQAEAQRAHDAGVKGLDGDGDGVACESLR